MNLFETRMPLVGDPSRVYLLQRVLALSNSETKVLDVGCGTCSLWKPLAGNLIFELWGLDIDKEKVKVAKKEVVGENRITVGDIHSLSLIFPRCLFDIIVSTQVLYQIRDINGALQEMNFVLKPNGKLLLTTELPRFHKPSIPQLVSWLNRKDSPKRRDEREMTILLEKAGFEVSDIRFSHIPPLKFIHNLVSVENKNKVMQKWMELEEVLLKDPNFMTQGKSYFRNLFMEAIRREQR